MKTQNNSFDVNASKINRSKTALLFAVLFSSFFLFNSFEAKAQFSDCLEGYTFTQFLTTYTIIDPITGLPVECTIGISYCFKIETDGTIKLELKGWGVTEPCWSNYDFNNSEFKDWIREKMIDHFNMNLNTNPVVCPNQGNVMILKNASCWGSVYEPNPLGGGTHRFIYCSLESFCVFEYEVCTDYNFTPPKTKTTLISSTQLGNPECIYGPIVIGGNTCKLFCE